MVKCKEKTNIITNDDTSTNISSNDIILMIIPMQVQLPTPEILSIIVHNDHTTNTIVIQY